MEPGMNGEELVIGRLDIVPQKKKNGVTGYSRT
jgi:hypothetical protein